MPDTPNASRVEREKAQVNEPSCSEDFVDNTYWKSAPPTPAERVEEVLARIKGVKHNVGNEPRTYYLAEQADLDALIAAVRSEEREAALLKARRELAIWQRIRERFESKVDKSGPNGCWLWKGLVKENGYGSFHVTGQKSPAFAHRVSWTLYRGEIPDGLVLDHICRVRHCVNPRHLRVVSNRQNTTENSIGFPAINALKTHCPHGHAYTMSNTRHTKDGKRSCKMCAKLRSQVRRARIAALSDLAEDK